MDLNPTPVLMSKPSLLGRFSVSKNMMFASTAMMLAAATSASAAVVAQNDAPYRWHSPVGRLTSHPGEETHGQTFTPTVAGQLSKIEIDMRRIYSTPITPTIVIVSLYETAAGLPTGPSIATQSMLFADLGFGANTLYAFDFTADSINLELNTEYAFMVGVDVNGGDSSFQPMGLADSDEAYAGGHSLHNVGAGYNIGGDYDVVFAVNIVPEPSSSLLLGLGGAAFILRRKK